MPDRHRTTGARALMTAAALAAVAATRLPGQDVGAALLA